ncbi:MAG: MucBP domain-containing protein, partial [Clostridia bacterium]|nr:MucBP domain-containing protein [Clostridia bacterium]
KIAPDEVIIDEYGNVVETKPTSLENENAKYTLVESPDEPNVVVSREDQEVTYYYQVEYKITTEVIKHDETVNGETVQVKGGSISGENETPYELVMRGRDSTKVIKVTPDEGYKIKEIKINGETYDFTDKLAEDGTVTLDQFTNVTEAKHITVEFEKIVVPAKVIVKYLEEGTNKVLKAEETKNGIVGDEYTTSRATIEGYEKAGNDPTNAKGEMTEEDTVVIYYYKKVVEPEPDPEPDPEPQPQPQPQPEPEPDPEPEPTPVTPDEPDVPDEPEPVTPDEPVIPDEPEQPSENDKPSNNDNNESKSPQTGDNIVITIITGAIATVMLVIVTGITKLRKNGKHRA